MRRAWQAALVGVLAAVVWSGTAMGGATFLVTGIKVGISCPGDAWYDGSDDTVTVQPWFDFCTVKITGSTLGTAIRGPYCDVFIWADDIMVKAIAMKGTEATWFYTTGQTYDCYSFKGTYTNAGNTDAYGVDVGLGMYTSGMGWVANTVALKYGVCWAGLLANEYFDLKGGARTLDQVLPEEGLKMLLGR